jgi:hypothetical protein
MKHRIYVASSWRNERQPTVVKSLREAGYEVYDFKEESAAFHWSHIDEDWKKWTPEQFRGALRNPFAVVGFTCDFEAMKWATTCVLVMPCGRSAHLEAGWFVGQNKPCIILLADGEPELMYKMAHICVDMDEVLRVLEV